MSQDPHQHPHGQDPNRDPDQGQNQGGNAGYGQPYPSTPGSGPDYGQPYPSTQGSGPDYGQSSPSGSPYPPSSPGYGGPQQPPKNGLGIAALVLGILAIATALFGGFPGIILGILAIIFGAVGMGRAKKGRATNRGMALAGLITGVIGLVIGALILYFAIRVAVDCADQVGPDPSQSEIDACVQDTVG